MEGKPFEDDLDRHSANQLAGQGTPRLPDAKAVALLERIIQASSNPGDMVLDPFCGCGTTIDAAEKLGRKWIGIDITQLAISLIKNRLRDTYGDKIEIVTIGEPTTPNEAAVLAEQDKYQFQWWALGLVGARPVEQKKGADHGIDGKILFRDDPKATKPEQIIIQVKGGKTGVKDVRDLRGVLDREKAAIGVLISLQPPTGPMEAEAASAGFYEHKMNKQKYPAPPTSDGEGIDGRQRHRTSRPVPRVWTKRSRKRRIKKERYRTDRVRRLTFFVRFLKAAKPRPRRKLRLSRVNGGNCNEINVRRTSSGSASGWRDITVATSSANFLAQRIALLADVFCLTC